MSLAVVISLVLSLAQFFEVASVDGQSMKPTFRNNEMVVVMKNPTRLKRGDVIALQVPSMADKTFIKRIIGLPGDTVYASGGTLYINDKPIERLAKQGSTPKFSLLTSTGQNIVPDKKLFVLGDNRQKSTDSRTFGFVDYDDIIGKVGL
ncbi:signal peptidase I [Latilactobacillus sakei]